jgi:hypothetical protein
MARLCRWVLGPLHCTACQYLRKRSGPLRMAGWGWDRGTGQRRSLVGKKLMVCSKLQKRWSQILRQSFSIGYESQDKDVCHDRPLRVSIFSFNYYYFAPAPSSKLASPGRADSPNLEVSAPHHGRLEWLKFYATDDITHATRSREESEADRKIRRARAQANSASTLLRPAWRTPVGIHATTLPHCNLRSSTPVDYTLDAYSSPSLARRTRCKDKPTSCHAQVVSQTHYCENVSLPFQLGYHALFYLLGLGYRRRLSALEHCTCHRQIGAAALHYSHRTSRIRSPVAILGLFVSPFAAPESVLSYTKPKYPLGLVHVPVLIFFSCTYDLVLVRFISTSPYYSD